jgi:hypothetical protein
MTALQITRHNASELSPKEALRAQIDMLSLDKQREFVAAALQLIAARQLLSDMGAGYDQSLPARKRTIKH